MHKIVDVDKYSVRKRPKPHLIAGTLTHPQSMRPSIPPGAPICDQHCRGDSMISGKGAHMYKGVGAHVALLIWSHFS